MNEWGVIERWDLPSGRAKPAAAAVRVLERGRVDEGRPLDPLDEELSDPVSGGDGERGLSVIHEHDAHLAAVVAVDDTGQGVDAVTHGQPTARPDEPDVVGGQLEPEARRHRDPASRRDLDVLAGSKVGAGGAGRGVGGDHTPLADERRHGPGSCVFAAGIGLRCQAAHARDGTPGPSEARCMIAG